MAQGHDLQGLKKVKPVNHYISHEVQSESSIHPDVLPTCEPTANIQSGTRIYPDIFHSCIPPTHM